MISPKSVTEPSRNVDFVGKVFDLSSGTLENRTGMLRGLMRFIESERNGEAVGTAGVGLKAISGTESFSGWGILLEARRG